MTEVEKCAAGVLLLHSDLERIAKALEYFVEKDKKQSDPVAKLAALAPPKKEER